jgi:hypothetical protein
MRKEVIPGEKKLVFNKLQMKGGPPIELFQRIFIVRSFDLGSHSSGIHSINPAPGNPLDSLHSLNRLHRRTIRFQVIKVPDPSPLKKGPCREQSMVDGFLKSLEFSCESKAAQIISCAQKSSISSMVSVGQSLDIFNVYTNVTTTFGSVQCADSGRE